MPIQDKTQLRVRLRIEEIARLRIRGLTAAQISNLLGLSEPGIARIVALPEYKETEEALLTGHVTKLDEALGENREALKLACRSLVPAAMRTLLEAVTQRRDLRASLEAAREILDRDPERTFAKATRAADASAGANAPPLIPTALLASTAAEADRVAKALDSRGPVVFAPQTDKSVN